MQVPIVDLGSSTFARDLDAAFRQMGFAQLVGHGLRSRAPLWEAMDALFDQPLSVKRRWGCDDPLMNRGYRARGSEALLYSLGESLGEEGSEQAPPPDLFESFNLRHAARATDDPLLAPPIWPEEVPSFRPAAEAAMEEMVALSARLDRAIGELLGIEGLAERSRRGPDMMACLRYRREEDERAPLPRQARMGAHSDYTTFTILRADPVPGLQILLPSGWLPVIPEREALLINVGDLLAMWTHDVWPSTVHRVPLLGGDQDAPLRRSVAYFHYPDPEVEVAPLPRFCQDTPPRYRPTRVADHLRAKLVGPKLLRRSEGESTLGARAVE